jgi:molybdate transport system permease protein
LNWGLQPYELDAIYLSVKAAVFCAVFSIPFSLLIGYVLARKKFYGKTLLETLFHLPLVMPPVTTGYLLLILLGTNGIVGKWLFDTWNIRIAFTFTAAVIASMVVSFPLFLRSVKTAIEMVDPGLEDASRILGAGKLKTFFRITLPLSLPGVISGFILAFARSLGEFGATISFAGNIAGETQTLPLAIYTNMNIPGNETATVRLVVISVLISFLAMIASEWFIRKMKSHGTSK